MKITGCCLPYGESKYHDAVQIGAFAHQDGEKVPLVRDFFKMDAEDNIIGHCILHNTDEGVMCDIHFNERYLSNHTVDEALCSHLKIGAWAVSIKRVPILNHELPASKFGNNFIVTGGRITAVAMNGYCLEHVVIEDDAPMSELNIGCDCPKKCDECKRFKEVEHSPIPVRYYLCEKTGKAIEKTISGYLRHELTPDIFSKEGIKVREGEPDE